MNAPQSPAHARKLAAAVQTARKGLAKASSDVDAASHLASTAKRKRKEAKEAARRAKKQLKLARQKLGEANEALATAEKNLARFEKHRGHGEEKNGEHPHLKVVPKKSRTRRKVKKPQPEEVAVETESVQAVPTPPAFTPVN